MSLWRAIDANGNRVAEGLRVLEDTARFVLGREDLQDELRGLRHRVETLLAPWHAERFRYRDAAGDPGFVTSAGSTLDRRGDLPSLVRANARRAAEGLRVLEEALKTLGHYPAGKSAEQLRRALYDCEQRLDEAVMGLSRPVLPEGLYGLTGEMFSRGRSNAEVVRLLIEGGVRIIQYREKEKPVREKLAECRELRRITRDAGVLLVVNDDPLIALETGADGIHIGQEDYPPAVVRRLAGPGMMIGLSTHSPEQAAAAEREPVDYIGVGPLYATATKKDVCAAVGLGYLEHAVRTVSLPFVAIGGIKEHNLPEVIRAGAKSVAMVTALTEAEDIPRTVRRMLAIMEENRNDK